MDQKLEETKLKFSFITFFKNIFDEIIQSCRCIYSKNATNFLFSIKCASTHKQSSLIAKLAPFRNESVLVI